MSAIDVDVKLGCVQSPQLIVTLESLNALVCGDMQRTHFSY